MRIAVLCLAAVVLVAGEVPPEIRRVVPQPPTIKLPPGEQPVEIISARYDLDVRGLHAETTATLVFRNPNRRALAGDLEFPLPDGATVCGYALDINGRMVDGVIVGKDQGRVILEAESRRRVDPGLVEHVRGNLFRTRIFPLPAQGTRTVRLTWVGELAVQGDEAAARVPLPRVALPVLDLRVQVEAGGREPQLGGFGNLALTRWRNGHAAETRLTAVTPGDDLLVRLPQLPRRLVVIEERDGERFVAIAEQPPALIPTAPAPPRRVAVAWDASGSRTTAGIAAGRAVLADLLRRWPATVVDLVVFRDVPEAAVACADAVALTAALDRVRYDGGTGLARLDLRRTAVPHADDAAWILLSDGLGTVGDGLPAGDDLPVHVVAVEATRDAGTLRLIASRSGGQVVDALALTSAIAAQRLAEPPLRLLRVDAAAGVLADVQIGHCQDRTLVLARLIADGEVTLIYGAAGAPVRTGAITVKAATAVPGTVIARAWAGAAAQDLAVFPAENRERLVQLGRRYGVVTPGTSLLVLESLDQYARHRVEPPATWPELRDQYLATLKGRVARDALRERDHRENLVRQWRERVAWWEGKHQPVRDDVEEAGVIVAGRRGGARAREAAPPVVPTTPPAIPAPARPASDPLPPSPGLAAATAAPAATGAGAASGRPIDASREAPQADDTTRGEHGGQPLGGADRRQAEAAKAKPGQDPAVGGTIAIQPFDPDAPYLRAITAAPAAEAYAVYLRERAARTGSPSFFLDCAGLFLARDAALGRRVLSNLAELRIEDPALLRVYAWRLVEAGDADSAVAVLRTVLRLRPEEPQSYRDLALALAERGRAADVAEGARLLHDLALRRPVGDGVLGETSVLHQAWDRFPDVEVIALEELNALLDRLATLPGAPAGPDLDSRLRRSLDCDLRVVMAWDRDATDIDLHVMQPDGTEAFYGRNRTRAGGLVSRDCTQGYGPEEYLLRSAATGSYQVRCRYYGSQSNHLFGPATVTATVFLNWGRPTQRRQVMTLRLDRQGEAVPVGVVQIGGGVAPVKPGEGAQRAVSRVMVQGLQRGLARDEIEARLGVPARVDSGGVTVLNYVLVDGGSVRIGCGPGLLWAREVLDGAERDLIR